MTSMNDIYSDEVLNVGKILAIQTGHKFKISEIKKSIRAKKVKKLKWNNMLYDDIDSYVIKKIYEGMFNLDRTTSCDFDVYYVTGDDAVSTFLRLKTSLICLTLNWDADSIKRLHNACYTKNLIVNTQIQIGIAKKYHDDLLVTLDAQKFKHKLKSKSKSINKISSSYAEDELRVTMEIIKDKLKSVW